MSLLIYGRVLSESELAILPVSKYLLTKGYVVGHFLPPVLNHKVKSYRLAMNTSTQRLKSEDFKRLILEALYMTQARKIKKIDFTDIYDLSNNQSSITITTRLEEGEVFTLPTQNTLNMKVSYNMEGSAVTLDIRNISHGSTDLFPLIESLVPLNLSYVKFAPKGVKPSEDNRMHDAVAPSLKETNKSMRITAVIYRDNDKPILDDALRGKVVTYLEDRLGVFDIFNFTVTKMLDTDVTEEILQSIISDGLVLKILKIEKLKEK